MLCRDALFTLTIVLLSVVHSSPKAQAIDKSTCSADSVDSSNLILSKLVAKVRVTERLEKDKTGSSGVELVPRDVPVGLYRRNLRKRGEYPDDIESQNLLGDGEHPKYGCIYEQADEAPCKTLPKEDICAICLEEPLKSTVN
jgi:hypothetical protein